MTQASCSDDDLPIILAGPILRQASANRLVIWLVTSQRVFPGLTLFIDGSAQTAIEVQPVSPDLCLQIGARAFVHCIDVAFGEDSTYPELPEDQPIGYDVLLFDEQGQQVAHDTSIALAYAGEPRPRFVIHRHIASLLHGSCRRPHNASGDGLARADAWLAERRETPDEWPSLLMLHGDQIYADDVAGPMLRAIHALIARLGLWGEALQGATVADDQALCADARNYYRRDELLPRIKQNAALRNRFFGGTRKPIFTATYAGNHLITLAETLAMYLLVWSDACWQLIDVKPPELPPQHEQLYADEQRVIDAFVEDLPRVRRLLAQVQTAMIFDDHDVTDDWNLTLEWESLAYNHPFSRRILGNALIGYFICQGWCNQPDVFRDTILPRAHAFFDTRDEAAHQQLIDTLFDFEEWHYCLPTEPLLLVLDSRTRRWRSERRATRPSGLMDWEGLSEMQQTLINHDAVVLVSPTPIFGVKLIENIQRVFIWIGRPLVVDAENWMAHRGAASVLLNIFRHSKTPVNFTVLSGDVHYSFAYDVRLRFGGKRRPRIWQITSSGLKNEFPDQLLEWFDRLNRWLFAPYSPLNWLTKRRRMRIVPRKPEPSSRGERLVNRAGIGYIRFDEQGRPTTIRQMGADGVDVDFIAESERD